MVTKIANNSLFGAMGNQYFRYFNINIARAITLTGQYIIKTVRDACNIEINKLIKTEGTNFAFYLDTDSTYLNLDSVVKTAYPNKPIKETVKFLDVLSESKIKPIINNACDILQTHTNAYRKTITFKREAISDVGLFVAKKRYALRVYDNEGVAYDDPILKIMGLSIIQSSTPKLIAIELEKALNIILNNSEQELITFIKEYKKVFYTLEAIDIAKGTGVNGIDEYKASTIYKKGTPINSRAALLYNHYIKYYNLQDKYKYIQEGDRIKMLYLKTPNPIQENIIGFVDEIPAEFGLVDYIDYGTQFEKVFVDPINLMIKALNWDLSRSPSLESLFD
jgi:DNA polymerase elongation subunit (family B)